ncbi:MAG: radical SAM protein [Candidatus Aminicenantales bacterium]
MERLPRFHKFHRIGAQLRHGQIKDLMKLAYAATHRIVRNQQSQFPFMLLFEVTNDCMLDCVMCLRSQLKEEVGYMSFETFRRIVDGCSRQHSLGLFIFSGMGEPLLHPQWSEMCRYAKFKGIPEVRLITNGHLLTEKKTRDILDNSRLDLISFSLDAFSQETYQAIKRSLKFESVQQNIINFFKMRKEKKKVRPFVSLHILKMKETISEISGFIEKWSPYLAAGDNILIKDVHTFAGQIEGSKVRYIRDKDFPAGSFGNFSISPGMEMSCPVVWMPVKP